MSLFTWLLIMIAIIAPGLVYDLVDGWLARRRPRLPVTPPAPYESDHLVEPPFAPERERAAKVWRIKE